MRKFTKRSLSVLLTVAIVASMIIPGGLIASATNVTQFTPSLSYDVQNTTASTSINGVSLNKQLTKISDSQYDVTLTLTGSPQTQVAAADVVLVLDTSTSVSGNLQSEKDAANTFLNSVLPGAKVAVIEFNETSKIYNITSKIFETFNTSNNYFSSTLTDLDKTTGALSKLTTADHTNTQLAIKTAEDLLATDTQTTNKFIVLFSDGEPNISYKVAPDNTNPNVVTHGWSTVTGLQSKNSYAFAITKFDYKDSSIIEKNDTYDLSTGKTYYVNKNNNSYKVNDNGIATMSEALIAQKTATIFTIGYGLSDNSYQAKYVLKNVASKNSYFEASKDNLDGLTTAFNAITTQTIRPTVVVADPVGLNYTFNQFVTPSNPGSNPSINSNTVNWSVIPGAWTVAPDGTFSSTITYRLTINTQSTATYITTGSTGTTGLTGTFGSNPAQNSSILNTNEPKVAVSGQGVVTVMADLYDANGVPILDQNHNQKSVLLDSQYVNYNTAPSYSGFYIPTITTNSSIDYKLNQTVPATFTAPTFAAQSVTVHIAYKQEVQTTVNWVVKDKNGNVVRTLGTYTSTKDFIGTSITVQTPNLTGYTLSNGTIPTTNTGATVELVYTIDYYVQYQNDCVSIGSPVLGGTVAAGTTINDVPGLGTNAPANHSLSVTNKTIDLTHTTITSNYIQDTGSVVIKNYLVNSSGQPIKADGITASSEATAQAIGSVSNLSPVNAGEPFSIIKGDENYAKLTLAGGYSIYGEGPYVLQTVTKDGTVYLYVPYTQTVTININYVDSNNVNLVDVQSNSYTVGDNFPTINTDTYKTFNSKKYKYVSTSPASIPSLVSSSPANVTIQYSDLYSYTVNYHYNDYVITLNGQAEFGESIPYMTHPSELDGSKVGFTFKNVDTEKTITENESANVLNVYFGNQYTFSVRYTENGTDFGKEPFTSAPTSFGTSMTANQVPGVLSGIPDGYKLNSITVDGETIANPTNVTDVLFEIAINQGEVAKNVVVVDYSKDTFAYTVLYKYGEIIDTTKTVSTTGIFGTAIPNSANPKDGYKLDSITNGSGIITSNPTNNVVTYNYSKDSFAYTVLYKYDGTTDTNKTVNGTGIYGDAIPNAPKPKDGYKLDSTANTTGTITSNADNNIVTYSYVKDNFGYKVNYSYNNVIDDTQTVVNSGTFGDLIPSVSKSKDGYKLVNVINAEGTITTNSANNVVTYVYVKDSFAYTVLYKYDGTIDSTKTTTGTGVFGDAIPNVAQPKVGYKLDSTINKNGTVTSNTANNVITYNYVKDTFNYTVLYVNQASGTVIATNRNGSGIFDSIASESPIEIIGYAPVSTASKTLTIGADATANVITFYYTQNVIIIDDSTPAAPAPATPTTTVTIPSTGTPAAANPHTGDNASALPIVAALFSIMTLLTLSIRKVAYRIRKNTK